MKTATVVGAGVSGCTWAHVLAKKGWQVTMIESLPFVGGGCKTFQYGGHPYTFGPRHLFTPFERVFDFLKERLPLRNLEHYLLTYVEGDGEFYSYPIHADDLPLMPDNDQINQEMAERPDPATACNFEEYWVYSVGQTLYEKFVKGYSEKMWQVESNTALTDFKFDGKGVALRTGTKQVRPDYSVAYPYDIRGWDPYFELCAETPGVTLKLNTRAEEFDVDKPAVKVAGEWIESDILVTSVSPDILFKFEYGRLEYIGRDFQKLVLPIEQVIPDPIYFLHYPNDEVFTRVVEYKKLTGHQSPSTLLGIEIPSTSNKLYPYPVKEQQDLADRYLNELSDNVFSVGRMGNYRYLDIGSSIEEALNRTADL
ncbi:UDP-galactopyranose mutase [SAR202 cluster bacterium AD-802-F09_MRT_200m]|nr:UDP-galactopyranose mutase [SAR202 cluster bacterium AD-802-F09_MRT_200m]